MEGLEKIADGREAEIFAWEPGKVLRLLRHPGLVEFNEGQALALREIRKAGGPAPEVYETVVLEGRPGIVMERVDAGSMLALLAAKPWMVGRAGWMLGRLHAQIHEIVAPEVVVSARDALRARLGSRLIPADLAGRAGKMLERVPDGDRLLHGDFHPDNVLVDSGRALIIDWSNLSRGDPVGDVARTLVMGRWAQIPGEVPPALRMLDRFGRRFLLRRYLATYRRATKADLRLIDRWQFIWAVARLAEGIPGEAEPITEWARGAELP